MTKAKLIEKEDRLSLVKHDDDAITLSDERRYACLHATWEIAEIAKMLPNIENVNDGDGQHVTHLQIHALAYRISQLAGAITIGLDDTQAGINSVRQLVFLNN